MRAAKTLLISITLVFFAHAPFAAERNQIKVCNESNTRTEDVMIGPSSEFIEVAIASDGQFTMGVPDGPKLIYGHPNPGTSYATIKVDGNDYTQMEGWSTSTPPTNSDKSNEGIWTLGGSDVQVHQIITLVKGLSTNKEDTYLLQWKLVNNSQFTSHTVGCRMMFDTQLGNNDGAPFRVPGAGSIASEQEWDADHIPPYFFVFNSLANPEVTAQGTLLGGYVRIPPTLFQIAYWGEIVGAPFEYTVNGNQSITSDSAYAVYWTDKVLAPGASLTFATYYGLGGISVDTAPPLVTTTLAPVFLECVNDPDDGQDLSLITPNPFEISLFLDNSATGVSGTVTGITATLAVPPGLVIPAGSATQTLSDMKPDPKDSRLLSWSVIADGSVRGDLTYTITVASSNQGTKVRNLTIYVPEDPECHTGDLPPIVAITAPTNSSKINCATTIQASAQDLGDQPGFVTEVQYFLDSVQLGNPVSPPAPFPFSWNTLESSNGEHILTAIAKDNSGKESKSNKVFVDVENPIITSVSYSGSTKKLKVYGDNLNELPENSTIWVGQTELPDTSLGKKVLDLYKCSFDKWPKNWVTTGDSKIDSAEPDPLEGGGGSNVLISNNSSIAHAVSTVENQNIKISFDYAFYLMEVGEGCIMEYSTTGKEGPWTVGFSAVAEDVNRPTSSGWKRASVKIPKEGNNCSGFWIRFWNSVITTHGNDNSNKFVRIDNLKVNATNYFLLGKKAPTIGHAQTVPVRIDFGACDTPVYWFTRP